MRATLRPLLVLFALLTMLTGVVYPLVVTGIGKIAFPDQASGSLVMRDNQVVGSSLIAQSFQDPKYFWGRLSATSPMPNNAAASGGSNLGPTNPALLEAVKARIDALKKRIRIIRCPFPSTSSRPPGAASIPHISPAAALYQVARVARARNWIRKNCESWYSPKSKVRNGAFSAKRA